MYKLDELSILFGRFEWDCYLIANGVRMLGDHTFPIRDYNKIKSRLQQTAKEKGVILQTQLSENTAEVIIYHPQEGKLWLKRLQALDRKLDKDSINSIYSTILEKIVEKKRLTTKEKSFLKKKNQEFTKLESKYGQVYGYSNSSIRRYLDHQTKD